MLMSKKSISICNYKKVFLVVFFALFCAGFSVFTDRRVEAITTLSPGDLTIISVNSDSSYPGGVNSNGFDFVSRVDLDAGTEIYFADKGWDGSLGSPFWRSGTGEGVLRYTVPVGGISAGTIIRYDDTMIPTLPSSGSATWDMYSINSVTGALALSTSIASGFDPANAGDNILVFQGPAASPSFILGIGWSAATTWISSGAPTANNSWIPSGISVASGTVVTLGSQDNYQYNCSTLGLYASNYSASLQNTSNWNQNDTTPYAGSACVFDASRPVATISQSIGQVDPTNNGTIYFTIVFDQPIDPLSFTAADITLSGTGTGTVASISSPDNITWSISVSATNEGTIVVSLPANSVFDNNANPNGTSLVIDDTVTYDITPPTALGAPDMVSSSDSGSSNSDDITNNTSPTFSGTCTDGDTIELSVDGVALLPTTVCTGSAYSITPSVAINWGIRSITVSAMDPAGNISVASSALTITIDTSAPSCGVNNLSSFDVSPEISGYTDDTDAVITVTIDGNSYTALNTGGNWVIPSGTIVPDLVIDQTYPLTIICTDVAGNINTNSVNNFSILRHVDLAVGVQLLNTGTILNGNSVAYRLSLTNTDTTYSVDVADAYWYSLVPSILTVPAPPMGIFSTSNSNIQCTNFGDATSIGDPFWAQYAGNNVLQCGFVAPTSLSPGEVVTFDLAMITTTDFPDGLTYRVLVYDERNYDADSYVLNATADAEGDAYALALNSVSRTAYSKPFPVVPPSVPAPENNLINAGSKLLLPTIVSTVVLGIAILAAKRSKQK